MPKVVLVLIAQEEAGVVFFSYGFAPGQKDDCLSHHNKAVHKPHVLMACVNGAWCGSYYLLVVGELMWVLLGVVTMLVLIITQCYAAEESSRANDDHDAWYNGVV